MELDFSGMAPTKVVEKPMAPVRAHQPRAYPRARAGNTYSADGVVSQSARQSNRRILSSIVGNKLSKRRFNASISTMTLEGPSHPDRNAQFEHIHRKVRRFVRQGQPVISVDTRKKELVGDFKNGGRELRLKGDPEQVRVHDFVIPELGRVTPYGVYDVGKNRGWVSVGIDHDTSTFAVESIRRWWRSMGKPV